MITKPKKNACQNCHTRPVHRRGRCHTCYAYLIRHGGQERPRHLFQKYCSNCAQPVLARGLCAACYLYQYKHGQSRPAHLATPETALCRNPNCRKPLRFDRRPESGYCSTCYQYKLRTGQVRPPQLTGGPRPWCDCGQPATRRYAVRLYAFGKRTSLDILDLCEDCYRLETGQMGHQPKTGQESRANVSRLAA